MKRLVKLISRKCLGEEITAKDIIKGEEMARSSLLGIRLDKKEKEELEKNARALGISGATAVKMMISQFNHDKGFSYPLNRKDSLNKLEELPEEVEKAMITAKAEELGLIKDTSVEVNNLNEWKKDGNKG